MSNQKVNNYIPAIGIECHVQLKTKTKLFSAISNDARSAEPNTLISYICLGMPGALPVLNEQAIKLAAKASFALGVEPQIFSKFDRKHYFYPDLPKGYQITQFQNPIVVGGQVDIAINGTKKTIRITRAHLEEDAGKTTHPEGKNYSLVDFNRAGTPLLEIVSEPDIHTPQEAKAYARELYLLMKYAGVSDANLFHGNMRFDVNVSVSKDPSKLGTRSETKNLNSFRSVEKAVGYEIKRQVNELEKGHKVSQETRGWDDAKQKTFSQRSKEDAHDYRYFPDPDLPPVQLSKEYISSVKQSMPIMPREWRERLISLGLDTKQVEILIEAEVDEKQTARLTIIESALNEPIFARTLANWLINIEIPLYNDEKIEKTIDTNKKQAFYSQTYKLLEKGKLSSTGVKQLISGVLVKGVAPANIEKYAQDNGLIQVSGSNEILDIVKKIIKENPGAIEDIKRGEDKAIGFLVGQVMKASQGKANPALTQELIRKLLSP